MTDEVVPAVVAGGDLPERGRDALRRHAWQDAFDLLSTADREAGLSGADLEALAEAAFFAASTDEMMELRERAFKARLAEGDRVRAAYLALDLARLNGLHGRKSIASAWAHRGGRLLDGQPESYAHGYLALVQSNAARLSGDLDAAVARATEAVEIGERTGDDELRAWALVALGILRIAGGSAPDGLALLEEASIAAVSGELPAIASGAICCTMIATCRNLTDYQRASEWIEATDRYCQRESVSGFPGACRIHRAEIVALGGAWQRAERELEQATSELAQFSVPPSVADGYYALGEVRRLEGNLAGAEDALRQAHALGRSPQPALALIRLAQGKVRAAGTAINAAVAESGPLAGQVPDVWAPARLLPAQVEISLAAGDLERAQAAAEELVSIVAAYPSPALQAELHLARGRVLLAGRDPAGAATELRSAMRLWRDVGSPYAIARCRVLLAEALLALDDDEGAELELQAARDEFARLGARLDLASLDRAAGVAAHRRARPTQVDRTFMFTDIVASTKLAEALGDSAWERLLRWHDRTLRELVQRSGGEIVNSTGDGFFVAFSGARPAIDCASAIQRALADQRTATGFAIDVRIGLHSGPASRHGDDYSGAAVHIAARVAALATGGEILATAETLAEVPDVATADPREVSLKGVAAPARVASIAWA